MRASTNILAAGLAFFSFAAAQTPAGASVPAAELVGSNVGAAQPAAPSCNCAGTMSGANASSYVCGDARLGPAMLPSRFPLLSVVSTYDRFGGMTPGEFLARWTNATTGSYNYPPQDGYLLGSDGQPIMANATLAAGTLLDRFGSPYGRYLAAAEAPYSQRALPPSSLDTDPSNPQWPYGYHIYQVQKPLELLTGPIAPWFGQPGLGVQFFTGTANVKSLLDSGYLVEVDKKKLPRRGGAGSSCG